MLLADELRRDTPHAVQALRSAGVSRIVMVTGLGFGYANVVVAVPQAWIDVRTMADLDDVATAFRLRNERKMRLATKYANLTRGFFAEHGVVDYRIVESTGATEGAPAAGTAEMIVDITTTGATLEANALKTLDDGTILRSQATLIASLNATWGPNARQAARDILARIAASEEARQSREVRARLPSPAHDVVETAAERFGAVSATGEDVDPHGFVALHCARDKVAELSRWLLTQGAERVSVAALEQTFAARNALHDALESRIGGQLLNLRIRDLSQMLGQSHDCRRVCRTAAHAGGDRHPLIPRLLPAGLSGWPGSIAVFVFHPRALLCIKDEVI